MPPPDPNAAGLDASSGELRAAHLDHDFSGISVRAAGTSGSFADLLRGRRPTFGPGAPLVDSPGDRFEREAERVAASLVEAPESSRRPGAGRSTEARPGELPGISSSAASGGRPLTAATRTLMEPRLGLDLGGVRIHTGTEASSLNESFGSRAFTRGPDIYFGRGQYRPESLAGRRLLAHELTHVAQQHAQPRATPALQRSAIAYWHPASFEERVATRREQLDLNINLEDIEREGPLEQIAARGVVRRQQRRFDRKVRRADPQRYEERKKEIEEKFKDKPEKRDRKLGKLKEKRDKAEEKLDLPELPKVLVIQACYHYLPVNAVNKQFVQFPAEVIEEVRRKFRVGGVWEGIKYKGSEVGVRFEINFEPHDDLQSFKDVDFSKPGNVPMRTKSIVPAGAGEYTFDYTGDPEQQTPNVTGTGGRFAEAHAGRVDIDAAAVRKRTSHVKFFERASDRDARGDKSVTKTEKIGGRDLSRLMASLIAHEIGHNIGMMHDDLGIMISTFDVPAPTLRPTPLVDKQGQLTDTIYELRDVAFKNVEIEPRNVELLVSRIDQMTQEGRLFWANEIQRRLADKDPSTDIKDTKYLEGSGITAFQAPPKEPCK